MPTYLDSQGNPVASQQTAAPVYLDDNGNPKVAAPPEKVGFWQTLVNDVSAIPHLAKTLATAINPVADSKDRAAAIGELSAPSLANAGEALGYAKQGNYQAAGIRAAEAVPVAGPIAREISYNIDTGDYGAAAAHGVELAAPSAVGFIKGAVPEIGAAAKGAAAGAAKATTEAARFKGLTIPGGNVMAGAVGGGAAAHALGLPGEVGAVIGGAAPIVKGAISGAREALAARTAAMARPAPVGAPAFQPRALLPAAPIVTPPPSDTSFVRSVPAQYGERVAVPPRALLNAPGKPSLVTPAPADTSFVRSAPLDQVNPQMAAQAGPVSPPVETVQGIPVTALDEMAKKADFKNFAEVPEEFKPLIVNQTKVVMEATARPAPVPPQPIPVPPAQPAPQPNVAQMRQTPVPAATLSRADLAKQALAQEMLKPGGSATPEMLVPPADTPTEQVTAAGKKAIAKAMRPMPAGMPTEVAKATYAGDQDQNLASATYEAAGRAEKAGNLAQMLHDEGLSARKVANWSDADWTAAVEDRGMPHAFSKDSQGEVITRLRRIERLVKK